MCGKRPRVAAPLASLSLLVLAGGDPTFKMCDVHDQVADAIFYRGWVHVVNYVNENFGGIELENGTKALIELKMNWIDKAETNRTALLETYWQKWEENVAWGCQVALVHSDIFPHIATASYLEAQGVISMLASDGRWTVDPDTGSAWQRTWNGAISFEKYLRGFIAQAASRGATTMCTTYKEGSGFGISGSENAKKVAESRYGMTGRRVGYNHDNSPAAVRDGTTSSLSLAGYVEPYNTSTWEAVLRECGNADILVAYSLNDGISLARYLFESEFGFKAVYMTNAPSDANFGVLAGQAGELITTPAQWHKKMSSNCPIFGSNAEFAASFEARYGSEPHDMSALTAFDAVAAILAAMRQQSIVTEEVNEGIKSLDNVETFFGVVQWGERNMQGRDPVLLQFNVTGDGLMAPVLPVEIAEVSFAWPIPARYFRMCAVHGPEDHTTYKGWEHVALYLNEAFGGIDINGRVVKVLLKMNWLDKSDTNQTRLLETCNKKWDENIAWGCQAALVSSDIFDFVDQAAHLEANGVISMLASGTRWTTNPRTGEYWTRTWNGAVSSKLYHRSFIVRAASMGARDACVVYMEGWGWGTLMSQDALETASSAQNGMTARRVGYNHDHSPAEVRTGMMASLEEETYVEPYSSTTWEELLTACGQADVLIAYTQSDGISLLRYIADSGRHFKAIYMTKAPFHANFAQWAGPAGEFVTVPSQWHSSMASECEIFGSNANFTSTFIARYGHEPHYMSALAAFDAVVVALGAIARGSTETEDVNIGIRQLDDTQTFFGIVQWGLRNMQGRDPLLLMSLNGTLAAIDPAEVATEPFAYPIPTAEALLGCLPGKYQSKVLTVRGAEVVAECEGCKPGRFSAVAALNSPLGCQRCPAGKFSTTVGSSSCAACPVSGSFSMTTLFQEASQLEDCVCPVGAIDVASSGCTACPEGLDCPAGATIYAFVNASPAAASSGAERPSLLLGYWSPPEDPLGLFACRGNPRRCPGGLAGACAKGRTGRSCSLCEDGKVEGERGECTECGNGGVAPLVVACFAAVVALFAIYCAVNSENSAKTSRSSLMIVLIGALMVSLLQQLGVIGTLYIEWSEPIASLLKAMQLLNFDIEVLQLNCVASLGPTLSYFMRLICVLALLSAIVSMHVLSVMLRHGARFREKMSSLVGAIGSIFMICFISMVSAAVAPFECHANPNGLMTVSRFQSVVCLFAGEHLEMILIALVFLLIPCGFLSMCCWAVGQFPARMRAMDTRFLHAFAFLFFRFRAETYWYVLVFLARSLILALAPVLSNAVAQLMTCQLVMVVCFGLVVKFAPWRVPAGNVMDMVIGFGMLAFLCCAGFFVREGDLTFLANLCVVFVVFCFALAPLVMAYAIYCKMRKQKDFLFFICHHKAGAGAFARLLKIVLSKLPAVGERVFVDSDNLRDLDLLFDHVGQSTETLVVLGTRQLLTRPWCVGEITTSKLFNVNVFPVLFPDYVVPDDAFVNLFASHVADVNVLTQRAISVEMVQDALKWFRNLTSLQLSFPSGLTRPLIDSLAQQIQKGQRNASTLPLTQEAIPQQTQVVAIADKSDFEVVASAQVLCAMLQSHCTHDLDRVPRVVSDNAALPVGLVDALVVCSNGCLQNQLFARMLFSICEREVSMLPVLVDSSFRFPAKGELASILNAQTAEMNDEGYGIILESLFSKIAVAFEPRHQASKELEVKAEDIAARLARRVTRTSSDLRQRVSATLSTESMSAQQIDLGLGCLFDDEVSIQMATI